jgi:mono/diheme cytochrome c family protein
MQRRLALALPILALAGLGSVAWWRSHNVGPAERGRRLATERGCLSCHGPAGRLADPDGALGIGSVPSFEHDDVTTYARNEGEIREWILDGKAKRLREDSEPDDVLGMPAWRGRLSTTEVERLVAYVKAVSDFDPVPDAVGEGRAAAARLGCFACHGPQGRFDTPNPGSLKGYVPAWSGADFPELARDEGEVREWIRDGGPKRLRENPVAAFFIRRQAIRMPAFGDRVGEDDVRRIVAYIRWLRGGALPGSRSEASCAPSPWGPGRTCAKPERMGENKRSSPRAYNVVEVECHTIDETATLVSARMSDVSTSGAFLDSMSGLRPGTKLALSFRVGAQVVQVAAEVMHTMPQFGMGVRSLNLSGEGRAAIEAYIKEQG